MDTGATARLSLDGVYRYELGRRWGGGPPVCWVMLNPSTADAAVDDRTIRKCMKFTRTWGRSALVVVNLFAFRATKPAAMKAAADPVGPENDDAILAAVDGAALTIVAWGAHGSLLGRGPAVAAMLEEVPLYALATNDDGSPQHPLYIKDDTKPQRWEGYE